MTVLKKYIPAGMLILFLFCAVLFPVRPLWASIGPEEVAVIVNTASKDSLRIGELYARLRNVPIRNIIRISVPVRDDISREKYDKLIAGPVRKAILELYNEGAEVRCILTTYGIPLRVSFSKPRIMSQEKINRYERLLEEKEEKVSRLKKTDKPDKEQKGIKRRLKLEITDLFIKLGRLEGHDTAAALDSELALLLVPDHQLTGWLPNPEYIFNRERNRNYSRILMVSRLDGPTPELTEGLVRTAIEVERTGLSGKVYLDARGKTGKDAYGRFDEDIRMTARILKRSSMQVILDNKDRLFRPGEAPHAALYCGWYSLGKYVDAFRWSKGAVGYHVASSEAVSLHNPKRKYWVKSMIENGVIASIGPVKEPYLTAFPPPSMFFPLLMSGKYTLVEVFAMTSPYLSWQMILVGDPLYNPFKNNPAYVFNSPPPRPPD